MASQVSRIFFIDHKIRTTGKVTVKEIMQEGDCSRVTAIRDIEALRDRLDAPIIYDRKIKGYSYSKEFRLLAFAGEQLFLFYVLSRGITKNPHYLPLTAEYARTIIIENLQALLPDKYSSVSDKFIYQFSDYEIVDFSIISTLIESFSLNKCCCLVYATRGGKPASRTVEPLRVICYGAKWYLAAYCYTRNSIRIFSFSRIEKISLTDISADKHRFKNTEIDEYLSGSFGIAKSENTETAIVRFYDDAVPLVTKQIWHPKQKVTSVQTGKGPALEFALPFSVKEELTGKVLKYGCRAEIMSPLHLREYWLNEIKLMSQRFINTTTKPMN